MVYANSSSCSNCAQFISRYILLNICMHTRIHICIATHTCTYAYIYICLCVCVFVYLFIFISYVNGYFALYKFLWFLFFVFSFVVFAFASILHSIFFYPGRHLKCISKFLITNITLDNYIMFFVVVIGVVLAVCCFCYCIF